MTVQIQKQNQLQVKMSPKLTNIFKQISDHYVSWYGKNESLIREAYRIATEEDGYSPRDAAKLIHSEIKQISAQTIRKYLPDEAKQLSKRRLPKSETKEEFAKDLSQNEHPPLEIPAKVETTDKSLPLPEERTADVASELEEDMEGEIIDEPPLLQSHGEPEDGKNVLNFYGDINKAQFLLWKSLSRDDDMPHVREDLVLDRIKPNREFRKGLIEKLGSMERSGLRRRFTYLIAMIEDTIEIIDEVEK